MKIVVKGDKETYRNAFPESPLLDEHHAVFVGRHASNDDVVQACPDAGIILFDAIATVDADLIGRLPQLKMAMSDGAGFDGVDLEAATKAGVYVCNNPGFNAASVAEQAVLLMLACLRHLPAWDQAVKEGSQIEVKERCLKTGAVRDLADCTVGLIGMGRIARETAARLAPFGCKILYTARSRKKKVEKKLPLTWVKSQEKLLKKADIVSLHLPSTPETDYMVDAAFLEKMKPGSILVNTGRGSLVDSAALAHALEEGIIGGAGLDTIDPEPVMPDNPLLNMDRRRRPQDGLNPAELLVTSPHIGGITAGSMRRIHEHIWQTVDALETRGKPGKEAQVNKAKPRKG